MVIFGGITPRELLADRLCAMIVEKIDCLLFGITFRASDRDWHTLSMALKHGWLTEERFQKAVHEGICREGRLSYAQHMRYPLEVPPDHVNSPAALGYTIKHGAITLEEAILITFDHGEDLEQAKSWAGDIFEQTLALIKSYVPREQYLYPVRYVYEIDEGGNIVGGPFAVASSELENKDVQGSGYCEGCPV